MVWFSPWLVVKNIDVEGVVHGDKDAIVEASGISENQKLIRLDTDASARSVAGQPWVDSVTVSRSWPQGVTISVREFTPVVFVRATDGEHLFSANGQEFVTAARRRVSSRLLMHLAWMSQQTAKLTPNRALSRRF